MIKRAAFVTGLVVGVAAGCAALYLNPLTGGRGEGAGRFDRVLSYAYPEDTVLATHSGSAPLATKPPGVSGLWETAIEPVVLVTASLRDEHGEPAAVGTRIALPSELTDLLSRGVILDDHWLVTFPGEGSLFVDGRNNVWPLVRDTLLATRLLGRDRSSARAYATTVGPGVGGTGVALGATGRIAGRDGRAVERVNVRGFGAAGFEDVAGELHLSFVDPQAEATAADGARPAKPAERPQAP